MWCKSGCVTGCLTNQAQALKSLAEHERKRESVRVRKKIFWETTPAGNTVRSVSRIFHILYGSSTHTGCLLWGLNSDPFTRFFCSELDITGWVLTGFEVQPPEQNLPDIMQWTDFNYPLVIQWCSTEISTQYYSPFTQNHLANSSPLMAFSTILKHAILSFLFFTPLHFNRQQNEFAHTERQECHKTELLQTQTSVKLNC